MSKVNAALFAYREDGPGGYTIMVVEVVKNDIGERAGYRNHNLYMNMDGHIQYADYDARRFTRKFTKPEDDTLLEFLLALKRGEFTFDDLDGRIIHFTDEVEDWVA